MNETVSSLESWGWICSLLQLANQAAYIACCPVLFPDKEANALPNPIENQSRLYTIYASLQNLSGDAIPSGRSR
jgi:hypothetical protein